MKIGREKAEIDQEVGVRQGDNVSSVIFLFLMSAFAETLEKEWKQSSLPEAIFKNVTNASKGQLTGHLKGSAKRGLDLIIHQILYIDNGAFLFEMREDATLGLNLINKVYAKLGLEMHIGRGENQSKTEAIYVPKASFYLSPKDNTIKAPPPHNTPLITSPADDSTDDNDAPLITQTPQKTLKKIFSAMNQKERENLYDTSPNTQRIAVADGHVDFVKHFKYLGSYLSFDLTDDYDIDKRKAAANKSMGSLKLFWNNPYASLRAKQLIFLVMPANQLLWGCKS